MNDLRLVLLGLGILVIAGIYSWEIARRRRAKRFASEHHPPFHRADADDSELGLEDESGVDYSAALADFNTFLNQSRQPLGDYGSLPVRAGAVCAGKPERNDGKEGEEIAQILALYVTPRTQQAFRGPDILQAMAAVDMHYGAMGIFHFYSKDQPRDGQAIFSLANMHEPGSFDLEAMDSFSAQGLALFMCLPTRLYGDVAFDLMLDTASKLAEVLEGDVRDSDHELLNPSSVNRMRDIACCY